MFKTYQGSFIAEWESCSSSEKAEIISEFLKENENGMGWEGWHGFLSEKFCIISNNSASQKGILGSS